MYFILYSNFSYYVIRYNNNKTIKFYTIAVTSLKIKIMNTFMKFGNALIVTLQECSIVLFPHIDAHLSRCIELFSVRK